MPYNGYEFSQEGVFISPLSNEHILYSKGGQKDSCFCSGSCSYNNLDPLQECDFHGGIQLDFFEATDYVSIDIISPFSNVFLKAFTTQGKILTTHVLKGNAFPHSLTIEERDITKVELSGSGGAWCMHKQLRFSKGEKPYETDSPTTSPTAFDHLYQHVPVSIKPRICPKILWMQNDHRPYNGIFPVAILGTDEFNVESIDITSVAVMGSSGLEPVFPTHYKLVDISSPSFHYEQCECSLESHPDGYIDIIFYFEKRDVIAIPEIKYADDGDEIVLTIKGVEDKIDHTYHILSKERQNVNSMTRGPPLISNDVEDAVFDNGKRQLKGAKVQDELDDTLDADLLSRRAPYEQKSTNDHFDDKRLYDGRIQIERSNEVIDDPRLNLVGQSVDVLDNDSNDTSTVQSEIKEFNTDDSLSYSYSSLNRPNFLRRLEIWIGTTIHQVSWPYRESRYGDRSDLNQNSEKDSIESSKGIYYRPELADAGAAIDNHEFREGRHYSGGKSTDKSDEEPVSLDDDDQLIDITDDLDFLYGDGGIQLNLDGTYSYEDHDGKVRFYGEDCIIIIKGYS